MEKQDYKSLQRLLIFQLVSLVLFFLLLMPSGSQAKMALPDVGINYQTMQVLNPSILKEAGMKDVKSGDKVKMNISKDGVIVFTHEKNGSQAIIKRFKEDKP